MHLQTEVGNMCNNIKFKLGKFTTPHAQRKCEIPVPGAKKSCENLNTGANIFTNSGKKQKIETEIVKNSKLLEYKF